MKITLSVDEQLAQRVRKKAEAMDKTLDQLVREYFERVAGSDDDAERDVAELRRLSRESGGHAPRERFNRDELHERP
jgi:phosphate uptake regulator